MLASLDDTLVVWIATHRWHPLDPVFVGLGDVDRVGAIWVVLAILLTAALLRDVPLALLRGLAVGLTVFAADSASFGVKDLFARPRPFVTHPEIHPLYVVHSSSFPAGHAATAFAGATLLAYFFRRGLPWFALLAVAIGFSRIYVGVHYPGDVLAGAAIGVAVGLAAIAVVRYLSGSIGWPAWLRPRRTATRSAS